MNPKDRIQIKLNSQQGFNKTIIGAICTDRRTNGLIYKLCEGNNDRKFGMFLKQIEYEIKNNYEEDEKFVLVLDNLAIHKSDSIKEFVNVFEE